MIDKLTHGILVPHYVIDAIGLIVVARENHIANDSVENTLAEAVQIAGSTMQAGHHMPASLGAQHFVRHVNNQVQAVFELVHGRGEAGPDLET